MSNPQFSYILPTDADERHRLDLQHRSFTLMYGKPYCPPDLIEAILSAPAHARHAVIDIGTGSGGWAEDLARAFPNADVTGVDIVPPESTASTPPNCQFRFEDVNKGFGHYETRYSIAQMRLISHGVDDFRGALHKVAEIINPGGLLIVGSTMLTTYDENKIPIPLVNEGEAGWCAFRAILKVIEIVEGRKFEVNTGRQYVDWLREDAMYDSSSAGEAVFYIPLGPWGSGKPGHSPSEVEAGHLMRENFKNLIPVWVEICIKDGALDSDTLHRWLKMAMTELEEMKPPLYMAYIMTWAKRSLAKWVNVPQPRHEQ